jgi:hypothetical protein
MKWDDYKDRETISRDAFEDHWRRAAPLCRGEIASVDKLESNGSHAAKP